MLTKLFIFVTAVVIGILSMALYIFFVYDLGSRIVSPENPLLGLFMMVSGLYIFFYIVANLPKWLENRFRSGKQ
jgi:hypothetical protein